MSAYEFHPENAIGEGLLEMDRQGLILFVSRLCLHLKAEIGSRAYHGGIFPENICVNEAGEYAVGPARTEKWTGQELEFIAPELYWHGETSPAADVYSLGMLLYYGLGGGRLPFETATSSGQLARMSGKVLPAPKSAGKRLGAVMEKATSFHTAERYQTPEELQIMLESCLDNKYLGGASGAEVVFRKEDGELSEIERMMVDIMESGDESDAEEPEEPAAEDRELSPEEMAGLEKPEPKPVVKEDVSAMVEEFFGSLGMQTEKDEAAPTEPEEPEDVRVYEPSREKKDRAPIPILTEEKNPELAPVVLQQKPRFSRKAPVPEQQQKVAQEVKMRRSIWPLTVVLGLCVLLLVGAILGKAFWNQNERSRQIAARAGNPTPDPNAYYSDAVSPGQQEGQAGQEGQGPEGEAGSSETTPELPRYYVVTRDVTWTEARDACEQLGGYLAVISSREEFDAVTALAAEQGLTCFWIGCHRVDDDYVWEREAEDYYYDWADYEPSVAWYGVAEDYILVFRDGDEWKYNDIYDDPVSGYPEYYSGAIGFVCEFDR